MDILYPKINFRLWPTMLLYAICGALVAGLYGIMHDQVTYSISPEYFTRMKFHQFSYADFGFPRRVFVAEIGFLATWWVGFFSAWFLARIAVPAFPPRLAVRYSVRAFLIILSTALTAGLVGYAMGLCHGPDYSSWNDFIWFRVDDLPNFVRVAYIHNAGYLGGLLGLIFAIVYLIKVRRAHATAI